MSRDINGRIYVGPQCKSCHQPCKKPGAYIALPTGHLCARCVVTANGTMQQRLVSNRRLIERLLWLMAFRGAGHEPDGTWQPLPPPEELLPPILPVQVGGITDTPAPVPE